MSSTAATANPVASADPPEFVIGLPADFCDLLLASEPANWDATAAAFLDLVPAQRPPEYRELALAHLRACSPGCPNDMTIARSTRSSCRWVLRSR